MMSSENFEARWIPEPNSGCWLWLGAFDRRTEYGTVKVTQRIKTTAHRASWALHKGPIPDGLMVCHRCDVRACVNPAHLFLGDGAANMSDAAIKGRMKWKIGAPPRNLPRGTSHHAAKLTADDVLAIRASPEIGPVLAKRYGVTNVTISRVRRRKNWGTVV